MPIALIVDDHAETRDFVATLLRRAGYETLEMDNGLDGASLSRSIKPDVIVTDIFMPGQDGLHVVMETRKRHPGARIIAISGGSVQFPGFDVLALAARLGADAVLRKPFTPDELVEAVTGRPDLG